MKIAFDVDDTLYKIRVDERDQIPDYDLIQVLRWFYNNGDEIYVWSAGGIDYTKVFVKKLGLDKMVTVIPKVAHDDSNSHKIDIAFDDCKTKLAKVDILVKRDTDKNQEEIALKKLENLSDEELEHACTHCPKCDKKMVSDKKAVVFGTKQWDGHTYKFSCKCLNKDIRMSSG